MELSHGDEVGESLKIFIPRCHVRGSFGLMPRLEIVLDSAVRLKTEAVHEGWETQGISFRGQEFRWHEHVPGHKAPVLTLLTSDSEGDLSEASPALELLSGLSFGLRHPVSAASINWSGSAEASWRPVFHDRPHRSTVAVSLPSAVHIDDDPRLRLCLGLLREGEASSSPFWKFLSAYNAIDAAFDGVAGDRDEFLNRQLDDIDGLSPAEALTQSYRNAIAHAVRSRPEFTIRSPDDALDRRSVGAQARLLLDNCRTAIQAVWPSPVTLSWRTQASL